MTLVILTKKQVLDILRKEKLTRGTYGMSATGGPQVPANSPGCAFCAVGQVVRAAMNTRTTVGVVANRAIANIDEPTPSGKALERLESQFEWSPLWCSSSEEPDLDRLNERGRARAINYVKSARFPSKVIIDIGDAKPRRGMTVVSPKKAK